MDMQLQVLMTADIFHYILWTNVLYTNRIEKYS